MITKKNSFTMVKGFDIFVTIIMYDSTTKYKKVKAKSHNTQRVDVKYSRYFVKCPKFNLKIFSESTFMSANLEL